MTTKFKQPGDVITRTAPSGGVVSGTAYLIGDLLAIATKTVAQTLPFDALVVGAVAVPKVANEAWTEGLKIYWDDTAKLFTSDPGSDPLNTLVGVAIPPIVTATVVLASSALAADLLIDNEALTLQVLDFAQLATDNATVTLTINGVAHVLTEGTDFTAETTDDVTATNLAAAIDALTAGADAAAVTDTVTVTSGTGVSATAAGIGCVRLDGAAR